MVSHWSAALYTTIWRLTSMRHEAANIPRPGLALGRYPERLDPSSDRLDEWFIRLTRRLFSHCTSYTTQSMDIIPRIETAGLALTQKDNAELSTSIADLRTNLLYSGWNRDLTVTSFALIRELSERLLGMRHYQSQLLGGWVMMQGKLAEMPTGEGKTLTAVLPAITAALAGVPVHVITANDYLADRDAEQMRPLYEAFGLTVGVVNETMNIETRRQTYACDITYCTNKQIAFDYLRDRVERGSTGSRLQLELENFHNLEPHNQGLMLRGLCFAIVDEADSVLIDEAKTPLVLSRTMEQDTALLSTYQQALALAEILTEGEDYMVSMGDSQVQLTTHGSSQLAQYTVDLPPLWRAARQRESLVLQALSAQHLYIRDRDYLVRDKKIQIIDNNTGRTMPDRSWELGLQQMIETKEECELSGRKETLARISYQRFFRRYLKLSGMTGTAREVKRELSDVYNLDVVPVSPHRRSHRVALSETVYTTSKQAIAAMVSSACEQAERGRPVLIGTRSVQKSEALAHQLIEAGVTPQVLNARQDANEAHIIAQAGKAGQITVTTNMAGRGTDIALEPGVADKGGLHVIVLERNDAARLDRQLYGRCARQGDPGSYQIFTSLEDELPTRYFSPFILRLLSKLAHHSTQTLPVRLGNGLMRLAQQGVQNQHRRYRRQLEIEDSRLRDLLSFSGNSE